MRPTDLAAIGIVLASSLFAVQATWTPTTITPAEAESHVGERVRMLGMVMDLRWFDDAARFVVVADGAAIHARSGPLDLREDGWVELEGVVHRDGGRPLLRVERASSTPPAGETVDLATVAQDPAAHADRLLELHGRFDRGHLSDKGIAMPTTASLSGSMTAPGVLRYEAPCVCFVFHVDPTWTP